MSSGLLCPNRYITVPLSFLSQSPLGTIGCPRDSAVPPDTSQPHCPSHAKVPLGIWDVLRTLVSHKRHHSPFPSQSPLGTLEFGMSSGFRCPTTYITVPLSFPSQNPLWEVLRNFTTIIAPSCESHVNSQNVSVNKTSQHK